MLLSYVVFTLLTYKSIATVDSNITLEERSKFEIVEQSKNLAHSGIEGSNFSGSKYSVTPQIVAPYISGELTNEYLNMVKVAFICNFLFL